MDLAKEMVLAGTTAVIVVNFTHPIDVVKTRMQVEGKFNLSGLIQNEGLGGLYKGIQPAWLREASYTSIKLGLYSPIKKLFGAESNDAPFAIKFAAGSSAGVIGSMLGNPFDVLRTLQITNHGKNVSLGELSGKIYRERGIGGFYRGIQANAIRACVLNGTKMACYDQIKGVVVERSGWSRKDLKTQFVSATGAGFCMACTVSPFDMLRTQLMNQPTDKKIYNGFMDCLIKTVKQNGVFSLYRGFFPIWARFAPQATGQLIVFDQLRRLAGMESL